MKKILISPLDWGLGHATRCIPIIRSFLEKGADVEIASAKCHKDFFLQEFPDLICLPASGDGEIAGGSREANATRRSSGAQCKAVSSEGIIGQEVCREGGPLRGGNIYLPASGDGEIAGGSREANATRRSSCAQCKAVSSEGIIAQDACREGKPLRGGNIIWRECPAYDIKYPEHGWQMPFWLLKQMPRIKKTMLEENKFLADLCNKNKYDCIISDNRFGFFNSKVKSIYITHQLRIAFPFPFSAFEKIGENWHRGIMRNFDEIWVPDYAEFPGLAGKLSHPSFKDSRIKYIGALSRLALETVRLPISDNCEQLAQTKRNYEKVSDGADGAVYAPKSIDILALISGPEPHRTFFEQKAIKILTSAKGSHCLIRGITNSSCEQGKAIKTLSKNLPFPVFNHLSAQELREKIMHSKTVICRSGYSTIMDLHILGVKAVFFPTPGQTEQKYLAKLHASA